MTSMLEQIASLEAEITGEINATSDLDALEAVRVSALGKKGRVTALMKNMGKFTP